MKKKKLIEKSLSGIEVGMRVAHEILGKGTVVAIEPFHNVIVQVHFDNYYGRAQWMADGTLIPIEDVDNNVQVECIETEGITRRITVGKTYTVSFIYSYGAYAIIDDNNELSSFPIRWFKKV